MIGLFRLIFNKKSRVVKRLKEDFRTVRLLKNWREFLSAKFTQSDLKKITLRNGIVLTAPPRTDLSFLFQEIWVDKTYNPKGYEIAQNDVVIDIGANIGVFSLYAATAALQTRIYAFEPFPENADYLRRNIHDSSVSNIMVEQKAVAQESSARSLEITESGITHTLRERESVGEGVTVECTTLNKILLGLSHCDLLKIDCEGGEYEVIYSCHEENLKKIRKIVGEYHYRDDLKKNGKALKEYLESRFFRIDHFVAFNDQVGLICATNRNLTSR